MNTLKVQNLMIAIENVYLPKHEILGTSPYLSPPKPRTVQTMLTTILKKYTVFSCFNFVSITNHITDVRSPFDGCQETQGCICSLHRNLLHIYLDCMPQS